MKRVLIAAAILAVSSVAPSAWADQDHGKGGHAAHGASSAQPAGMSDGEIRKVDKEAKKITVRHGPLTNLDMPAMTMVFQVQDPGMLDRVKAGDKVKFVAEKIGGAFTITKIEPSD